MLLPTFLMELKIFTGTTAYGTFVIANICISVMIFSVTICTMTQCQYKLTGTIDSSSHAEPYPDTAVSTKWQSSGVSGGWRCASEFRILQQRSPVSAASTSVIVKLVLALSCRFLCVTAEADQIQVSKTL